MTIHKDGRGTILGIWMLCAVLIYLVLHFIQCSFISYPLTVIVASFMIFVFYFFRVPERETVQGENVVTSAADGEVVIVDKVYEDEFIHGECIQVSVYMDFFNVHVNFWPISGEVTYYKYHPGKYFLAFMPKASELNEHTSVAIRNGQGEVFFKQIAGTFARRIVSYAEVGKPGVKGEQCGIIKFGSRVDMFLPLDADIKVQVGDYVKACESVIAEL
ncbi:MAG: phosphatidylserine decarboxylase family protein [Bacteroidetes bacterium]|uniref:Phosphatidylserine decarboxylase family protein n=1 Tax=Candidatus Cryptobacteroides merdavium TaxID=2840769 RepID=A0A9D9EHP3_9BACT|nr:phosphatidylserine decarboxylase family protein [Candidatus Cryptobacteroides merdavium]